MTMEVIESTGSKKKTTAKIDFLSDRDVPRAAREKVKEEIAEFIKEQTLLKVGGEESPIRGEKWPRLSSKYAAKKKDEVGNKNANLELTGDMLDAFDVRTTKDGIEVGIWGKEAWKADGHNKLSGASNETPKRRFIPDEGQRYDKDIEQAVDQIINDVIAEEAPFKKSQFKNIETKSALFELLKTEFTDLSKPDIIETVKRSTSLFSILEEFNLLRFLK